MKILKIHSHFTFMLFIASVFSGLAPSYAIEVDSTRLGPVKDTVYAESNPDTNFAKTDTVVGKSYFGRNNYIEYVPGNLPVIISVPHGGDMFPSEIPTRSFGSKSKDVYTIELGKAISAEFFRQFKGYPHIVYCHLHRSKLDANRDEYEAAQDNKYAVQAFAEWHGYLRQARRVVKKNYGRGHAIDLHGHGHAIARLELGYLIDSIHFNQPDSLLAASQDTSGIRTLPTLSGKPFLELFLGKTSFGGMMQDAGYPAIPSPQYPRSGADLYFTGGPNTRFYGSKFGGNISGFLMECNNAGIRDTDENRTKFGAAFAKVMGDYLKLHYKLDITNFPKIAWGDTTGTVRLGNNVRNQQFIGEQNLSNTIQYFDAQGKLLFRGTDTYKNTKSIPIFRVPQRLPE